MHLDPSTIDALVRHGSVALAAGFGAWLRGRHLKSAAALAMTGIAALTVRVEAVETFLREHLHFTGKG